MQKRFIAVREDQPGSAWLTRFVTGQEEAERWYRGRGLTALPSVAECRTALRRHMPELVPQYDRACQLIGDDDLAHRMLSHYRPPSVAFGCTHAIWLGDGGPALVRNYDFPLEIVSPHIESTSWSGREVIAKAQRPWGGCLDGMNEDGLVASLAFGGSPAQGVGFSVILLLRYVLETCRYVDEAVAALSRIPIAASQNVVLLDRYGSHATLFLGPDRAPAVMRSRACANHQDGPASRASAERLGMVERALADPSMTLSALITRFLAPPLYSRTARFTTVYTAVYRPAAGRVDYIWPGRIWSQAVGRFVPGSYTHDYGDLTP